jgi:molecular chaperone DnaK (HSP70)
LVQDIAASFVQEHRVSLPVDGHGESAARVRTAAEALKIELSSKTAASAGLAAVAYGAGGQALDLNYSLSRMRFESLISQDVARTFPVCEQAMSMAGLRPEQVDEVIMVGGTTKIPLVRSQVSAFFGRAPRTDVDPDRAVALGAGLHGAAIAAKSAAAQTTQVSETERTTVRPPPIPGAIPGAVPGAIGRVSLNPGAPVSVRETTRDGAIRQPHSAPPGAATLMPDDLPTLDESSVEDTQESRLATLQSGLPSVAEVSPHSYSIGTVGGFCRRIVTRSTGLPTKNEETFITSRDAQVFVQLKVYQGESRRIVENTLIGHLRLDGLARRPRGETRIDVTFDIDNGGLLKIAAVDQLSGKRQEATLSLLGGQSPQDLAKARERFETLNRPT